METLSGVASGMAVASLSIQLIESIAKIRTFIRGVRSAPQELLRLVDLLGRLALLLEDVRNIMERQTLLHAQQVPTPSMTTLNCLKSCQASIKALEDALKKYDSARAASSSRLSRLRDDVKFGIKMKDVASHEEKIHKDMNYLQMALGVNDTTLLVTMLPLLLQSQQATPSRLSQPLQHAHVSSPSTVSNISNSLILQNRIVKTSVSQCHYWVPFTLKTLCVFRQRTSKYNRHLRAKNFEVLYSEKNFITKIDDIFLHWTVLGRGLHWQTQYPCGNILPFLRVFPVIENTIFHKNLIKNGSIRDIQESITSGAIHPFMREKWGNTLLHTAALHSRADVCHLLLAYGLDPEPNLDGESPLNYALLGTSNDQTIDIVRLLMASGAGYQDDFNNRWLVRLAMSSDGLNNFSWLWFNVENIFGWADLPRLLFRLLVELSTIGSRPELTQHSKAITMAVKQSVNHATWDPYIEGDFCYLNYLDHYDGKTWNNFLNYISELGCDVASFFRHQIELLPDGLLQYPELPAERFALVRDQIEGWKVYGEWIHDSLEPGFLLVSEFFALGADTYYARVWPFSTSNCECSRPWDNNKYWPKCSKDSKKWGVRFERRMAAKARKERARSGQKLVRSRMPGAWVW